MLLNFQDYSFADLQWFTILQLTLNFWTITQNQIFFKYMPKE
jgi:hypothetical protein